jgi:hypothetical protein
MGPIYLSNFEGELPMKDFMWLFAAMLTYMVEVENLDWQDALSLAKELRSDGATGNPVAAVKQEVLHNWHLADDWQIAEQIEDQILA